MIASMSNQRVSCYTPISPRWRYDVFLSFRGEDTRKNFTDHLYAALHQRGIHVFRDDKELERGKPISPELLQAIESSKVSIIVFSQNYASSTWCLDELVKIVECMETRGQKIIPVFYDVDPSVVRKQTEDFQKAFTKHEGTFDENKILQWRTALTKVANISGWVLKDRYESESIHKIVTELSSRLSSSTFMNHEDLIGIKSRAESVRTLINIGFNDVRMIGIYGMGGIGKTTVANVVYDLISFEYEGSCFLADVTEISKKDGLVSLQKKLLFQILRGKVNNINNVYDGMREIRYRLQHKKILIVVDDVSNDDQLNKLVGKHDWFGAGSRIIITTRDEHLLITHGVDARYKAEELNHGEALQLFSMKAFHHQEPSEDFEELVMLFLKYASGLPLALLVLGSFLHGRTLDQWKSAFERIHKDFNKEILDVLWISFDRLLEETEKKIFLDIACFFKSYDKDYVIKILDGCSFSATIGIDVLVKKSLITITRQNKIWMHDLLQEMGRQIVKRESLEEPGKRSRLWDEDDIRHVLINNTGTDIVEGIIFEKELHLQVHAEVFSKMRNLRLLKIRNVQLLEDLEYLSNKLRLLKWYGHPSKFLPSISQLDKLVDLDLHCIYVKQLWEGVKFFDTLRLICLKDCPHINKLADLKCAPNLEELILQGCTRLGGIYAHLLVLKKLIYLEVRDCISFSTLPCKIHMESLEKLKISGCPRVKNFPEIGGKMERMQWLFIDGTTIKHMPPSLELLTGLKELILINNNNLVDLPSSLDGLTSLRKLDLSGCSKIENIPKALEKVDSLKEVDLSGTALTQPVSSIFLIKDQRLFFRGCKEPPLKSWYSLFSIGLKRGKGSNPMAFMLPSLSSVYSLRALDLGDCNLGEGAIPYDIFANLPSIKELNLSGNNFFSLPASINLLSKLEVLELNDCKRLQSLPELSSSIVFVYLNDCASLETISNAISELSFVECFGCLKLAIGNDYMFSKLQDKLKGVPKSKWIFSIVGPGGEIPKWMRYQTEGHSINIKRPPDLHNNMFVGFLVCCIVSVQNHLPLLLSKIDEFQVRCDVRIDGRGFCDSYVIKCSVGQITSKILWLNCISLTMHDMWRSNCHYISFNFSCFQGFRQGDYGISTLSKILKVERCGFHPIYEQGLEDLNRIVNQSSSSASGSISQDVKKPHKILLILPWMSSQLNASFQLSMMIMNLNRNLNDSNYFKQQTLSFRNYQYKCDGTE